MPKPPTTVLLLLSPHLTVKRDALAGIEKAVAEDGLGWELEFLTHLVDRRDWAAGPGVTAAIAWPDVPQQVQSLTASRRPVVWMGHVDTDLKPAVRFDNEGIGRMVAAHFRERGLRSFAFYAERPDQVYSRARWLGFATGLAEAGEASARLALSEAAVRYSVIDSTLEQVAEWLRGLPKPVGVMCDRDGAGMNLLIAARRAGLRVPDEVAVVGVGGDDVLCALTRPRLSSVRLPGMQAGREAVRLLAELLKKGRAKDVCLDLFSFRQEASSEVFARHDEAVNTALGVIRDEACGELGTDRVARAAGLSRRVLERRFRLATGRTVHDEITRVRIERACRFLVDTKLGLAEIAERCGYAEPQRLAEAFRRRMGCSPGAYRKTAGGG